MIEEMALELLTDEQKQRIRDKMAAKIEKEIDNMKAKDLIDTDLLAENINEAILDSGNHQIADVVSKWLVKKVKADLGVK